MIEITRIHLGEPSGLQALWLNLIAKGHADKTHFAGGTLNPQGTHFQIHWQVTGTALGFDQKAETLALGRLHDDAQLPAVRIKAPVADGAVAHITHGIALGHLEGELSDLTLGRSNFHQMAPIDHTWSGNEEIRNLAVELCLLRGNITLASLSLDHHILHGAQ